MTRGGRMEFIALSAAVGILFIGALSFFPALLLMETADPAPQQPRMRATLPDATLSPTTERAVFSPFIFSAPPRDHNPRRIDSDWEPAAVAFTPRPIQPQPLPPRAPHSSAKVQIPPPPKLAPKPAPWQSLHPATAPAFASNSLPRDTIPSGKKASLTITFDSDGFAAATFIEPSHQLPAAAARALLNAAARLRGEPDTTIAISISND